MPSKASPFIAFQSITFLIPFCLLIEVQRLDLCLSSLSFYSLQDVRPPGSFIYFHLYSLSSSSFDFPFERKWKRVWSFPTKLSETDDVFDILFFVRLHWWSSTHPFSFLVLSHSQFNSLIGNCLIKHFSVKLPCHASVLDAVMTDPVIIEWHPWK